MASVFASLACAPVNLLFEQVACRMEAIQFPRTYCFIPEFVFLPPLFTCKTLKRFSPTELLETEDSCLSTSPPLLTIMVHSTPDVIHALMHITWLLNLSDRHKRIGWNAAEDVFDPTNETDRQWMRKTHLTVPVTHTITYFLLTVLFAAASNRLTRFFFLQAFNYLKRLIFKSYKVHGCGVSANSMKRIYTACL